MKNKILMVALLASIACLSSCTSKKSTSDSTLSGKSTSLVSTEKDNISSETNGNVSETTSEKEIQKGSVYDDRNCSFDKFYLSCGDTTSSIENEKVKLSLSFSLGNLGSFPASFIASEPRLYSSEGYEITSGFSVYFGGEDVDGTHEISVSSLKSAKFVISTNFNDEKRKSDTYYYLTCKITDEEGTVYLVTFYYVRTYQTFTKKEITIYEGETLTKDDFTIALSGSTTYVDGFESQKIKDNLTVTNNGELKKVGLLDSTLQVISYADPTDFSGFLASSPKLDDSSMNSHSSYEMEKGKAITIDLDYSSYENSEICPLASSFSFYDATNELSYVITMVFGAKA